MTIDFTNLQFNADAYSNKPFCFLEGSVRNSLATVMEISMIENGDRLAREFWQNRQLNNLLTHAVANSPIWRNRIPRQEYRLESLSTLPVQTRMHVMEQVKAEGSLFRSPGNDNVTSYASSGSTGIPVKVFSCAQNGQYNVMRSMAQYFMEGRRLDYNRTFIKPADGQQMLDDSASSGVKVQYHKGWLGSFSTLFQGGAYKIIYLANDDHALINELRKESVGYLACLGSHVDILLRHGGVDLLRELDIKMWLHHSDNDDAERSAALHEAGIPIRSSYSCAEVGPIAVECCHHSGYYHVSHSNVIVEVNMEESVEIDGVPVGDVLLTHLHSYATPIIRYQVGDMAALHDSCPCGHDGPVLSHIRGRRKSFLRHPKGHLVPFFLSSKALLDVVSFSEFHVHQPDLNSIVVELGGCPELTPQEHENVETFISRAAGAGFDVVVKPVDKIDWSSNPKRLLFTSAVA